MPGMKDTVTVKVDDKRTKMQKRLLLMDLKELYALFKESYPKHMVSFSTFAKLLNIVFSLALMEHTPFVFVLSMRI